MSHKTLFTIITSTILLTSCSIPGIDKKEVSTSPRATPINKVASDTTTGSAAIKTGTGTKKLDPKAFEAKRKEVLMKDLPENEKNIFLELEKARKTGDATKIQAQEELVRKLQESKKAELDAAVKSGDIEKAKKLRKEMMIFSTVRVPMYPRNRIINASGAIAAPAASTGTIEKR